MHITRLKELGEKYFSVTFPIDRKDLKTLYRRAAMKHHPDRGGNPKAFQIVLRVYEEISKQPNSSPFFVPGSFVEKNMFDCWECGGRGRLIEKIRGRIVAQYHCNTCDGKGQMNFETWKRSVAETEYRYRESNK